MNTDIFIKYDTPQRTEKFKKQLIQLRGHQCECCKNFQWLDLPINLELHHKDGDKSNNELTNLQLLCPNCHSYTDNYGSRNKKHNIINDQKFLEVLSNSTSIRQALFKLNLSDTGANYIRARQLMNKYNIQLLKSSQIKENFCIDCGKSITLQSTRCVQCEAKTRQEFNVSRDELKKLIRTVPFTSIGQMFNVSDTAIRKRCKVYNLPTKKTEIKNISNEDWELI